MTEATLHYSYDSFGAVIEALLRLPEPLRPIFFGHDENVKKRKDMVSDTARFQVFLGKSPSGFFLYAERAIYSICITALNEFEVYVEDVLRQDAYILLRELAGVGIKFAYVADGAERNHRNRLIKNTNYGIHEAWVGRDWHRYVPGLYWLTVIPETLARQHDVPLSTLSQAALAAEELAPGIWLLKFFESPEEWRAHAGKLDRLCEETNGVFAISCVKPAFDSAGTFFETNEVLQNWQ